MIPPVQSPIRGRDLARATIGTAIGTESALGRLTALLRQMFAAEEVGLTDSGTSALVVALRSVVPRGGTVALPAYGCVDLVAAAVRSEVGVRLYDIEPATLGPDLDSLGRAVERGVDAVVVAHLYGYAVDMAAVRGVLFAAGVPVIEDAAQHAGARIAGRRAGSDGPVVVLSFARGKGTTGGRGGAVFAAPGAPIPIAKAIDQWGVGASDGLSPRGWGDLARAAAQWAFGRPGVYAVPASIPALGLGETVYRPAGEPGHLSRSAALMVERTLARIDRDRVRRAGRADWYVDRLRGVAGVQLVHPVSEAEPGYLRFPILVPASGASSRAPAPHLGVVWSYPRPLRDEPAIAAVLKSGEPQTPGAREVCERLFTLPTHTAVSDAVAERVVEWVKRSA